MIQWHMEHEPVGDRKALATQTTAPLSERHAVPKGVPTMYFKKLMRIPRVKLPAELQQQLRTPVSSVPGVLDPGVDTIARFVKKQTESQ